LRDFSGFPIPSPSTEVLGYCLTLRLPAIAIEMQIMNFRFCNAIIVAMFLFAGSSRAGLLGRLTPVQIQKTPSVRVTQHEPFSYWFFGGTTIDEKGKVAEPKPAEPLDYIGDKDLSEHARQQLARLRPGTLRAATKKHWSENGGLTCNEFILLKDGAGPKYVAVRIEWRPNEMAESVFADRKKRLKWLRRHAPLPALDDVLMRVSKPYWGRCVWD
jgi:hypothetical protein